MPSFTEIPVTQGSDRNWHVATDDFSVRELYFDPGLTLPTHYHEHACLSLLVEGPMKKGFGGRTHELPASSLITIPAGETHTDWFGAQGSHIVVVELDVDRVNRKALIEPGTDLLDEVVEQRNRRVEGFAARLSSELRDPDDLTQLAVNGLVMEMIASFGRSHHSSIRSGSTQPRWMAKAIDYLHENDDRYIRIEDVAAEVDLHPGYLARAFRQNAGTPIGSYAREIRLDRVAAALADTDDRILDIAMAAGFTDQSHLTRLFKRRFGVTPAQYRATLR